MNTSFRTGNINTILRHISSIPDWNKVISDALLNEFRHPDKRWILRQLYNRTILNKNFEIIKACLSSTVKSSNVLFLLVLNEIYPNPCLFDKTVELFGNIISMSMVNQDTVALAYTKKENDPTIHLQHWYMIINSVAIQQPEVQTRKCWEFNSWQSQETTQNRAFIIWERYCNFRKEHSDFDHMPKHCRSKAQPTMSKYSF